MYNRNKVFRHFEQMYSEFDKRFFSIDRKYQQTWLSKTKIKYPTKKFKIIVNKI